MRNFKPPRNDFGQIIIYFFAVVSKGVRQIYCSDRNTSIPFGFPNILRNFHKMNSSSETGKKEWKIVSHDLAWLTNSCLSQVLRDWISVYVITSTFLWIFCPGVVTIVSFLVWLVLLILLHAFFLTIV